MIVAITAEIACGFHIYNRTASKPPVNSRKSPFSKIRKQKYFKISKFIYIGNIDHGLPQFIFPIWTLHEVSLVNHINQMLALRHSPKNLTDPYPKFNQVPTTKETQFANINMATLIIKTTVAHKGFERENLSVLIPCNYVFRLYDN